MIPNTFAIVDVETTGLSPVTDRVIEVAVIRIEEGKEIERYSSLVNPQGTISPLIQSITGISPEDLEGAPAFEDIAPDLASLLEGAVLMAHNARFDYGFLKNEFKRMGVPYVAKQLCTVKLSRRLFPQERRHGLDHVIRRHGIRCSDRHRAMGDAEVVWEFYKQMQAQFPEETLLNALRPIMKQPSLPPQLPTEVVMRLPQGPGVYIFHGKSGVPLYIGKSVTIQQRVRSHFADDYRSSKEMRLAQQVVDVEARETAGELGALLLESRLMKDLQPLYNRQLRYSRDLVVVRGELNNDGFLKLRVEAVRSIEPENTDTVWGVFRTKLHASEHLRTQAIKHNLCDQLLGLESHRQGACFGHSLERCLGACCGKEDASIYNSRVSTALTSKRIRPWPYDGPIVFVEESETRWDGHVIDQWSHLGTVQSVGEVHALAAGQIRSFDYDTYQILKKGLSASPDSIHVIP